MWLKSFFLVAGSSPCGNTVGYPAILLMGNSHSLFQFICYDKQCHKTYTLYMYPYNTGAFIPVS